MAYIRKDKPDTVDKLLLPDGTAGEMATDDALVVLDGDESPLDEAIDEIVHLEDGSVEINTGPAVIIKEEMQFDSNLVEYLSDSELADISSKLPELVDEDEKSREGWEATCLKGIEYLGLRVEDRSFPFQGACGVYDPMLLDAVIRTQAQLRGEMLPAAGPVKTEVIGDPTQDIEDRADRVKEFMNLYLTQLAPEYYEDTDQMLLWLCVVGSTFRKVYQDRIAQRPKADFILFDQLIVNYAAKDLNSARATHVVPTTKRDLMLKQLAGEFIDTDLLPSDGLTETSEIRRSLDNIIGVEQMSGTMADDQRYYLMESHADWSFDQTDPFTGAREQFGQNFDDLPLPYRITYDKASKKILSVYRNWKPGDPVCAKRQWFVHHKFLPGLGFYGLGYAHILGGYADGRTKIMRQYVDSGTFANFPAGIRVKGMRIESNDVNFAPGEWKEVDTGGLPANQAMFPLPYKEPSDGLIKAYELLGAGAEKLAGTSEIAVGEGRQDAPVGTTMALMEAAGKVQSGTMKRLHVSFRREFSMLKELFYEYLPPNAPYPFNVKGGRKFIMKEDFSDKVNVLPVSDPNITNSAQKTLRSETIMRIAQTITPDMPQYQRNAVKLLFANMNVENPDAYLPPPPQEALPLDPLTENQNALMGLPLKAAAYQDHLAHIEAHQQFIEMPAVAAHIQEHVALQYRQMIESKLGGSLPVVQGKMPPEIENEIARMTAEATKQLKLEGPNGEPAPQPIDPMAVALEEVKVKREKVQVDAEIKQKEIDAGLLKAQLESENEAANRANRLKIARMKTAAQIATDNSTADAKAQQVQAEIDARIKEQEKKDAIRDQSMAKAVDAVATALAHVGANKKIIRDKSGKMTEIVNKTSKGGDNAEVNSDV